MITRRPKGGKNMKKYEIMYIVKADLEEEARKAEIEKLHAILTSNGGKITNVNEWGLRNFAYPINDMLKGYYVVIKVTTDDAALKEFVRLSKINPNVVRHLITVDKD
jgi:small subunit ribosomal protein S6